MLILLFLFITIALHRWLHLVLVDIKSDFHSTPFSQKMQWSHEWRDITLSQASFRCTIFHRSQYKIKDLKLISLSKLLHKIKKLPTLQYHVRIWVCTGTISFGKVHRQLLIESAQHSLNCPLTLNG